MPDGSPIIIGQANTATNATTKTLLERTIAPQPPNNPIFHVHATPHGPAIQGQSGNNTGVIGTSDSFRGVHGNSTSGEAVRGDSGTSAGVRGHSNSDCGVLGTGGTGFPPGTQTSGIGVVGIGTAAVVSGNSTSGFGVSGQSDSSVGAGGRSNTSTGVQGRSTSGFGVGGFSTSSAGTIGSSTNSTGVRGVSTNSVGVSGSGRTGVSGFSKSNFGGEFEGPKNTPGVGSLRLTGNVVKFNGEYSEALPHPDGSQRLLYVPLSPESWYEDFGRGELVEGQGRVEFDPDFAAILRIDDGDYHVFLTPE